MGRKHRNADPNYRQSHKPQPDTRDGRSGNAPDATRRFDRRETATKPPRRREQR